MDTPSLHTMLHEPVAGMVPTVSIPVPLQRRCLATDIYSLD